MEPTAAPVATNKPWYKSRTVIGGFMLSMAMACKMAGVFELLPAPLGMIATVLLTAVGGTVGAVGVRYSPGLSGALSQSIKDAQVVAAEAKKSASGTGQ